MADSCEEQRGPRYGYNNAKGNTHSYEFYLVFDPATKTFLPTDAVRYKQVYSRLDNSQFTEQEWTFGCDFKGVGTTSVNAMAILTKDAASAAQEERLSAITAQRETEDARRIAQLKAERPAKSQIGAHLCKTTDRVLYEGFTEARSPDNDKIQIRVTRASYSENGRPSAVMPGGFREQIIWDHPDNWHICQ